MKTLGFCQPKELGKQSSSCSVVALAASEDGIEHCLIQDNDFDSKDSISYDSDKDAKSSTLHESSLSNKNGLAKSKHLSNLLNGLMVQSVVSDISTTSSCIDSECDKLCENSTCSLSISVPDCLPTVKQQFDDAIEHYKIDTLKNDPCQSSLSLVSPNNFSSANFCRQTSLESLATKFQHHTDESNIETVSHPCFVEVKTSPFNIPLIKKVNITPLETNYDYTANLTNDRKNLLKLKDCCKNSELDKNSKCDCQIPLKQAEEKSKFLKKNVIRETEIELPRKRISLISSEASMKNVISTSSDNSCDNITIRADITSDCSKDFHSNAHLHLGLEGKQYSDNVLNENSCIVNLDCKENITNANQSPDVNEEVAIANNSSFKLNVKGGDDGNSSTVIETSQYNSSNRLDYSTFVNKLKNESSNISDGSFLGNRSKLLSVEKNLNSPLSISKSSSNTPMFSETPSDASQSDMMVKISDAVAALFSRTTEESLSEYVDPTPEELKGDDCKFTDAENSKNKVLNMNLNFTNAFINKYEDANGLSFLSGSCKTSNIHKDPGLNSKSDDFCDDIIDEVNFLTPAKPSCSRHNSENSEVKFKDGINKNKILRFGDVPVALGGDDLISNMALKVNAGELSANNIFFIPEPTRCVITELTSDSNSLDDANATNRTLCEDSVGSIPQQLHNTLSKIEMKCKNGLVDVEKLPLPADNTNCKLRLDSLTSSKCLINEQLVKIKIQDNEIMNTNECLSRTTTENYVNPIPRSNNSEICEIKCENVISDNINNSSTSLIAKNEVLDKLKDDLHLPQCKSEGNLELCNDTQYSHNEVKLRSPKIFMETPVIVEPSVNENDCGKDIVIKESVKENVYCESVSVEMMISKHCHSSEDPNLICSKEIGLPVSGGKGKVKRSFSNSNDSIKESCLQDDSAIFLNNSSSDKSSSDDFEGSYHADENFGMTENSYFVKSDFIEDNNLEMVKFSLNEFLQTLFESDSGKCNICEKFIEKDLKLHAAQEHSCITYIPAYLSENFQLHMKERVGITSIPCCNVTYDKPSYVCKTCGFLLKSIDSVRLHMNIHENVYMVAYSNGSCKCKRIQYSYLQHKLKSLLLGSAFICSFCNYCFACEYGLINHLKCSHFRFNSCLLCNVEVSHEDSIKVLAHNESHNTNTEQILSNLLVKDFIEPLRDQTYFSWNALNNHLNYLDGKIFRLRTPKNIMNHNFVLSIPVKADPEYAVTPDQYITSPASEINKYLKGKLVLQLTGTEIDEYASFGFDMPVQILFQKKFCTKKGRKRNLNFCLNKASSRINTRFSIPSVLNLHKLHNVRHSTENEPISLPLRRSSRHSKSSLEDPDQNKILKQEDNEEVDVHLTRTRSGMRPKDHYEEDTNIGENQEPLMVQPITYKVNGSPAEISGEWENYHTFVCCSCGAVLYDLAAIMDHKWEAHPGVWCAHTMIRGQETVPEMFCRQYLPSTVVPEMRGKKKISRTELDSYICTQCKESFSKLDRFHTHLIECGGLLQLFTSKKKARNKKNFRFRRRKGQGIPSQRYANNSIATTAQKTFDSGSSTPSKDLPFQSHKHGSMSVVKRRLEMAISTIENKKLKNKLQVILSRATRQKREMVGQRRRTFKMKLRKKMQQKKAMATKQPELGIKKNKSVKVPQAPHNPARSRRRNSINNITIGLYDEKVSGTAKVILQDIGINEIKAATSKSICSTKINRNSKLTKKLRNKKTLLKEKSVSELSNNNTPVQSNRKKQSSLKNRRQHRRSDVSSELQSNSTFDDYSSNHNISKEPIETTTTTKINVNEGYKANARKIVKKRSLRNSVNSASSLSCMSNMSDIVLMEEGKNNSLTTSINCNETIENPVLEVSAELHEAKVAVRNTGSKLKSNETSEKAINKDRSLTFKNVTDSKVELDNEIGSKIMAIIQNSVVNEVSNGAFKSKLKCKKRNSIKNKIYDKFNSKESTSCKFHKKGFKVCPAKLNYTKSISDSIFTDGNSKIKRNAGSDFGSYAFKFHASDKINKSQHHFFKSLNAAPDNLKVFSKMLFTEKSVITVTDYKEKDGIQPVEPKYESFHDFVNLKNFASNLTSLDKGEASCSVSSISTRPLPNLGHKLPIFVGKTKKRVKRLPKNKSKVGSEYQLIEKSSIYELSYAVSKCSLNSTDIEPPSERLGLTDENCRHESNIDLINTTLSSSSNSNIINGPPNEPLQLSSLICKNDFEGNNVEFENSNSNAALAVEGLCENSLAYVDKPNLSECSEQMLNKGDKSLKDSAFNTFKKEKCDNLETAVSDTPHLDIPNNLTAIQKVDGLVSDTPGLESDGITLNKNSCLKEFTFPEGFKNLEDSYVKGTTDVCDRVKHIKKRFVRKVKNNIKQKTLIGASEKLENDLLLDHGMQNNYIPTKVKENTYEKVKTFVCGKSSEIKSDNKKNILRKLQCSMKKKLDVTSITQTKVALNIPYQAPPPVHIKRKMRLSTFIDHKDHEESKDDSDGASEPEVISNFRRERYIGRVGLRKRHFQSPRYSLRPPLALEDKKSLPKRSAAFGNLVSADEELPLSEKLCESDEDEELIMSPKKFRKCNIGDDDNVSIVSDVKSRRSSFSSDDEMLLQRIKKFKTDKKIEVSPTSASVVDHLEGDEEIFQNDFERSVRAKSKSTPSKISVMDQLCNLANQKFGRGKIANKLFTDSSNFDNILNNKANKGSLIKSTLNRLVCGTSKKNVLSVKRKKQKRLLNKKAVSISNLPKDSSISYRSQKSGLESNNKKSCRRRSSCSRKKRLHMTPKIVPSDCDSVSDATESSVRVISDVNPCEDRIIEIFQPSQSNCTENLEDNRLPQLNVHSDNVAMPMCENEVEIGLSSEKLLEKRKKSNFKKDIKDKIVLQDNNSYSFSQLSTDVAKDDNLAPEKGGICLMSNELFKKSKRKYSFSKKISKDNDASIGTNEAVRVLSYKSLNTGSLPIKHLNLNDKSDITFSASDQPDKLEETKLPVKKKRSYKKKTKSELDENSPTVREVKRKKSVAAKINSDRSVSNLDSGLVEDPMALFCADCGLSFDSPFSLEDHQQDCRNIAFEMCLMDEDLLFECPYCQLTFALKSTQRQHTSSCRAKRSRKNSSRKRNRQANVSNRIGPESKKNSTLVTISNDPDISAFENVSQIIENPASNSNKESLTKNANITEMSDIADRLLAICEERPEFCAICALLYSLKVNTNDMRNLLTSSTATLSETIIQLHSHQLNCMSKNLDTNYEMLQIILEQATCFNLPSVFKSCLQKYSVGNIFSPECIQAIENRESNSSNEICISLSRPELLQALSSIEELLKEAEEVQIHLKKKQMLHAMKETFQAGTGS